MQTQKSWLAVSGVMLGALTVMAGGALLWQRAGVQAKAQGSPAVPGPGGRPGGPGGTPPGMRPGPPMGMPGGGPTPGARPGMMPGGPPGTSGAAGPAGNQQGAKARTTYKMPFQPRKDPFALIWKIPPPPPYVFNEVQPVRVASVNVTAPPPPNTEIREVPARRVSGIMSGDGVFAILEGAGTEPEIVKPGSETRDGYKVVAISADTVTLRKQEGNVIRTQIVPLSDIPPGQAVQIGGPGRFGAPGGPGAPATTGAPGFGGRSGFGRGGGGRPGDIKD